MAYNGSTELSAFMVHHKLKNNNETRMRNGGKIKRKRRLRTLHSTLLSTKVAKNNKRLTNRNHSDEEMSLSRRNEMHEYDHGTDKMIGMNSCNTEIASSFDDSFNQKTLFQWMIAPTDVNDFMAHYWETKPLHVSGNGKADFSTLISTPGIDKMLVDNNIQYTKNIDITCYENGLKELCNPEGRARPHVVWDFYCNKCSVRLLNPQTYFPNIHKLCSELQEYFGCFVGCNAYLTPPNSQGFSPHYDDIEAFILQIEGKKRWKLYEARSENERLPRYSSEDLEEIDLGKPMEEVVLNAGDMLYIPRGCIHQACTENNEHSLHITVSAYQRNAWIDLLEEVLNQAKEKAWENDLKFRKGLPLEYLHVAGIAIGKSHKGERAKLENYIRTLIYELVDHVDIDFAVDKLGTRFMFESLPPVLTEEEKRCSVHGSGHKMGINGVVKKSTIFGSNTEDLEICLLRKYVARLTREKMDKSAVKTEYRLYYSTDNSLEYRAIEPSFLIIGKKHLKMIQYLFQSYPNFVSISQLPGDDYETKVNVLCELWDCGIIRTRYPLDS